MYPQYMCILLYVTLIWCNIFHRSLVNWNEGGRCILSICALCYMCNLFCVMVFHRSIVNWSGDTCILSICAFCYM